MKKKQFEVYYLALFASSALKVSTMLLYTSEQCCFDFVESIAFDFGNDAIKIT